MEKYKVSVNPIQVLIVVREQMRVAEQDRCPAQTIDCGNGKYRFLTELDLNNCYADKTHISFTYINEINFVAYYITINFGV